MENQQVGLLHRLAKLHNIETSYIDSGNRLREASPRALLATLGALGAPVTKPGDIPDALRKRKLELWRRCCPPVLSTREGSPTGLEIRLPSARQTNTVKMKLVLENGETRHWTCSLEQLPVLRRECVEGTDYAARKIPLPSDLPTGYHRCLVDFSNLRQEVTLIVAPYRAYVPRYGEADRTWGVFLPLHALRSKRSWAAGDTGDLGKLLNWVGGLGGSLVGTLPLLAAFLDKPYDHSPYAPVSRMFWNEFFLDVTRIPELKDCPQALELLNSHAFREEAEKLRNAPLVDYRRGMLHKRRILEILARYLAESGYVRLEKLRQWAASFPRARDYARFRAAMEQRQTGWLAWPERMQRGDLQQRDYDPSAEHYHLYVQWLAREQMQILTDESSRKGTGLYLDLPLGVHLAGYDVWSEQDTFALGASCGAPPDQLNTEGQDWNFPPLHPEGIRVQGYRYFIECLRHHLKHARALRLDHVMGLYRLFWIPRGLTAREGVYVKYNAEDFFAVLALESQRYKTLLIGEDLGTVPVEVGAAMERQKISRMYILPFELNGTGRKPGLNPVPTGVLAGLNTHDMPPFAAYWQGLRYGERAAPAGFLRRRGLLREPSRNTAACFRACLAYLAASPARVLMVNLEDLWLESAPQNVPGTGDEQPNWRRKARLDLEHFTTRPDVRVALRRVDGLRRRSVRRPATTWRQRPRH